MRIIFSFIILACTLNLQADTLDKKLHNQCLYPVVKLSAISENSYGTATIVKSIKKSDNQYHNIFISCNHICAPPESYFVMFYVYKDNSIIESTKKYNCIIYAKDKERDLSIGMFVSDCPMPTAKISFDPKINLGNDAFRIGCGAGDDPRLDYGKITSLRSDPNKEKFPLIRTSIFTIPGDSGGPLFNSYKIIGITKSIRGFRGNMLFNVSYFTPVSYFRDWSNENNKAFDFAWSNTDMPILPFWELDFIKKYEVYQK